MRRRGNKGTDEPVSLGPEWIRQRLRKLGVWGVVCVLLVTVAIAAGKGVLGVIEDKAREVTAAIFDGDRNPPAASGPLVTIVDIGQTPKNGGWIIPGMSYDRLGPVAALDPDKPAAWKDWEAQTGAVRALYMSLEIALQATSAKTMLLTGLDIKVLHRRPPLAGLLLASQASGGPVDVRRFEVDLDSATPTVNAFEEHYEQDENGLWTRPADFPFKVSEADPEYFRIEFATTTCDCELVGMLHWIADGRKGTTQIDNGGKPFRITARTAMTSWYTPRGCRPDIQDCD